MTAEEPVDFPKLLPPPVRPPDVYLIGAGANSKWQRGLLAHTDWTIDGRLVKNTPKPPIEWLEPVDMTRQGFVKVRIVTESAPRMMEVRQFGGIDADGMFAGKATLVMEWWNPRLASRNARLHAQMMKYNWEPDPPGWELRVPVPAFSAVSYMNVWAEWHNEIFVTDTYSANWKVSARRLPLATLGPEIENPAPEHQD